MKTGNVEKCILNGLFTPKNTGLCLCSVMFETRLCKINIHRWTEHDQTLCFLNPLDQSIHLVQSTSNSKTGGKPAVHAIPVDRY